MKLSFFSCLLLAFCSGMVLTFPLDGNVGDNDTSANRATKDVCPAPYTVVGNRCLLFDTLTEGTFDEMRQICQILEGEIVKVEDANLLADIVDYINLHELTEFSFWVGATDVEEEGAWKWIDGSPMRLGTPWWYLWPSGIQAPEGGTKQNCAFSHYETAYYLRDDDCAHKHKVLCEFVL